MDDLKDFVEKIQEEGKDYTLDQWKEANERFQKLLDKINSYEDLTKEGIGKDGFLTKNRKVCFSCDP